MNKLHLSQRILCAVLVLSGALCSYSQTAISANYAMPAGAVDTTKPGFRVRPYQTDATHGGSLAWSEEALAGLHGANTADLTGADSQGYLTVPTVVNWNISAGNSVDNLPGADAMPGIGSSSTVNFTEEVLTYIQFSAAGTYTMGVNSDDGFGVATALLNPKDRFNAIEVGQYDSTRGSGDTLFSVSVSQAGIYPFRLVYFQVGGGANVSWFTVVTNNGTATDVLINDSTTPGALKAYASAKVAPPYAGGFVHSPAGFSFTINDDVTALAPNSLQVKFNGSPVNVKTSKSGSVTTVSYAAPSLIPAGVTNTLAVQFTDNAATPNNGSATFTFVEPGYTAMPVEAALPPGAVDITQRGFLMRVHQIDSNSAGVLAANVAHAEAQLAGLLLDPATSKPYANIATAGTQPDGSYAVNGVINFSYDTSTEQGSFTAANGHADTTVPGITGGDSSNIAAEIVTYLDLQPGFYTFAVSAADGFRLTAAANPYDALGVTLGLFDGRSTTLETRFGVAVQNAGIYPVRLLWYRMSKLASGNIADAGLEFYTVNADGSKSLVNDTSDSKAVKAYWKRTAGYGTFVKYAGPSAFVSPFGDSNDVGFKTINIVVSDGTTNKVTASSLAFKMDGTNVTATPSSANGLTTLSFTPDGLQLPRTTHTATLSYADSTGASHTSTWNFHLLRNYVLPAALFFEDFESTDAGPNPSVPKDWVQLNYTDSLSGHQTMDPTDLNSDFYLGWVVVDKSFNIGKDAGVSAYAPQELNGKVFSEDTNPLLVNHYVRAESDVRGGNQVQYLTTPNYDLTGKTGIVIAFDSSYEQNQDNINALEYTTDNGATWNPILYWMQGDGVDSQAPSDVIRDGLGNIDVNATMLTTHGDAAVYTDPVTKKQIGHQYGAFIGAPITPALAPYIEGRVNDDATESKRIELYRAPLADNQKSVKFRFLQAGTGSWYWCVDNWGVYAVPSQVSQQPSQQIKFSSITRNSDGSITVQWAGGGTLQAAPAVTGPWQDVTGAASPYTLKPTGAALFGRIKQ